MPNLAPGRAGSGGNSATGRLSVIATDSDVIDSSSATALSAVQENTELDRRIAVLENELSVRREEADRDAYFPRKSRVSACGFGRSNRSGARANPPAGHSACPMKEHCPWLKQQQKRRLQSKQLRKQDVSLTHNFHGRSSVFEG